jgi:hypothetical protein
VGPVVGFGACTAGGCLTEDGAGAVGCFPIGAVVDLVGSSDSE